MSEALPESKSVMLVPWLIAFFAFMVIVTILVFVMWPETGGGWVSGLRDFIKAVKV